MYRALTTLALLSATPVYSAALPTPRPAIEKVNFASTDLATGKALTLSAVWVRAIAHQTDPQTKRKPTVIAMHGCGGLYSIMQRDKNTLTPRHTAMIKQLRSAGYNVLLPDSLTPRGLSSMCSASLQQRAASSAARVGDIQSALRWLAQQDDVDPKRIALLGWANGGSAVLAAINPTAIGTPSPKAAIAFYPTCAPYASAGTWNASTPLLILIGANDDWTPPAPCRTLAAQSKAVTLNIYPDSEHAFDAPGLPTQTRYDVPNPQHPGQAVTTGYNQEAQVLAYRDLLRFLDATLH